MDFQAVQWVKLQVPREEGFDLWLEKIPHAKCHGQREKKRKKFCRQTDTVLGMALLFSQHLK